MDSTTLALILFISGTIITLFGFFLRNAYNDTRKDIELLLNHHSKTSEELGKLKGKIELVQQENQLKYQAIQELTQLEIKNLAKNVSELSDAVKELIIKRPTTSR
jgi:arsenate reductase-like glutaredoxin family protein